LSVYTSAMTDCDQNVNEKAKLRAAENAGINLPVKHRRIR
jgi:hypothetical protein